MHWKRMQSEGGNDTYEVAIAVKTNIIDWKLRLEEDVFSYQLKTKIQLLPQVSCIWIS